MQNKFIPLTLEQHQQILYEILYMVDDFCRAHNIDYFLVGGTLLGAVRHQGIIPWDDDVDIAMTRENYDRFIELFNASGVDGYELLDFRHKDGYLFPFAKMTKCDTWTSCWETHRIYIDIFSYEGCDDDFERAKTYFSNMHYQARRFVSAVVCGFPLTNKRLNWKGKVYYLLTRFLPDLILFYPIWIFRQSPKSYLEHMHQDFTRYRVSEKKYCANVIWGLYGKGEVQLSTGFLHLEKMRFGTRDLPVPSSWHNYLTGLYGNYMTPLPENKRKPHLKDIPYLIVLTEE